MSSVRSSSSSSSREVVEKQRYAKEKDAREEKWVETTEIFGLNNN